MRISIVTICTPEMAGLGALSLPNKRGYCGRHGYSFMAVEQPPNPGRAAVWGKIPLILDAMGEHQWIFWAVCLEDFVDAGRTW